MPAFPPRAPRPSPDRERRQQWALNLAFLLVAGAMVLVINLLSTGIEGVRTVPFSHFLEALDREAVAAVAITPNEIAWSEAADGGGGETPGAAAETGGTGSGALRFRATRVPGIDDQEMVNRLYAMGAEVTGEIPSDWGSRLLFSFFPILLLIVLWLWIFRRMAAGRTQAMSFGASRARIWDESGTRVTFNDVAGVDEAVAELREVVDFLQNPERYLRMGARIPKGVLLVGPTGTGKTLLARATAGEAGVPFFSISGADFVEMFVGVGAARVRDLFRQARERAPCIVFIDEIDTVGKVRAGAGSPVSNEEREQTLNQLLVEMDGFDSSGGVILMAATNRPDLLDPALQRPGRFDRQVVVDRPDLQGREAILRVHARRVQLAAGVDLHVVAARTPGFAGAQLANVINEGALLAVRGNQEQVTMGDLDEAVDRVLAGLERTSRALIEREREIVAHHEMGHAFMGMLLPHADPVHKVSIVPRGTAALGVTIQTPLHDRYLLTEAELRDRLTVLLGGRAAEEVCFGETSTGAADDLQRAADVARRMVTQFGMSVAVGPVALEPAEDTFHPGAFGPLRSFSEDTARVVDGEIRELLSGCHARAIDLLRKHEAALRTLAAELREREVLEGADLRRRMRELGIAIREDGERASTPALP